MDQAQLETLRQIVMVSSSLTFIGSSLMFASLCRKKPWFKDARVDEKILGALAITSFLQSLVQFQSRVFLDTGGFCVFLAFINEWMGISEMMLNMFLSMNFSVILLRNGKNVSNGAFYVYLSIALGLPLIGAIVALSLNAYGDAITSCWIIKSRTDLRNILYFGPLWTFLLLSILLNSIGVYKVYVLERKFSGSNQMTRIASKSFVYCTLYVIVWIFPTASRLYEAFSGFPPFWLFATHSFCISSTGFFTSIGYFLLQYTKENEVIRRRPSGFMSSIGPATSSNDTGQSHFIEVQEENATSRDALISNEGSISGTFNKR